MRRKESMERRRLTSGVTLWEIIDVSEAIDSIDTIDPTVDGTGEIDRLSSSPQATMCGAMISVCGVIRMTYYLKSYQNASVTLHVMSNGTNILVVIGRAVEAQPNGHRHMY